MSFILFDSIISMFYQVFGHPAIVAVVLFLTFIIIMGAAKVPIMAIMAILVPMMLGLGLTAVVTGLVVFPMWIYIVGGIMVVALIFATLFFQGLFRN